MADHTSAATEAGSHAPGDGPPPEPTFSELLEALCAAEYSLQRAADHIQHREGFSSEFRAAANAADQVRAVVVRAIVRRAMAVKQRDAGGDG
jgi:hypothetical protein